MSLLDLIRRKRSGGVATAIPAISATAEPETWGSSVARIATIAVASPNAATVEVPNKDASSRRWRVRFAGLDPVGRNNQPLVEAAQGLTDIACAVGTEAIPNRSPRLTTPDQYGHWSESEVELVKRRTGEFVRRGIPYLVADELACSLVERDREVDHRHLCAECDQFFNGRCQQGVEPPGGNHDHPLHWCEYFRTAAPP